MLTGGSVGAGWDQLERGRSEGGPSGYSGQDKVVSLSGLNSQILLINEHALGFMGGDVERPRDDHCVLQAKVLSLSDLNSQILHINEVALDFMGGDVELPRDDHLTSEIQDYLTFRPR